MEPLHPRDDERTQEPDDDHRAHGVAPLDAQGRDSLRRQKQHHGDTEIGRIPDVAALDTQDVLGGKRDQAAERVGPEPWGAHQDADADSRDIGAGQVRDLAVEEAAEHDLGQDRSDDCQSRLPRAFQNADREVPAQQDTGDEERGDEPLVDLPQRRALGVGRH